ncbi:GntR family transcriptional regulator [Desulfovibrio litoralis]|uniref:Transcriptional regulator, GntR family n=1 Tax=Desulfovibrio litoralis DSM 11393 TaxID=1121455 RepID=A0A1M7SS17_9BACT|nr:GntR family transcriptional regulator [Desulfovibrio litoralis]SHN61194.1 transcriptional regulator, GntR family [Desulfovibrio litoralis DSM 11393]
MFQPKHSLPLYYQITEELRTRLKNEEWKEGDLFPTDKYWATQFNVSITTIRQALAQLVSEGFLYRRAGKGTFVQLSNITEKVGKLSGFFDEIRAKGKVPTAKILSSGVKNLDSHLLSRFPILSSFKQPNLFLIDKRQCMNNMPVARVLSFWREDLGRQIEKYDLTTHGMYDILDMLGIKKDFAEQFISAEAASPELSEILEVPKKTPLMRMDRLLYSNNQVLEFSVNWYRSDRYRYTFRLDA